MPGALARSLAVAHPRVVRQEYDTPLGRWCVTTLQPLPFLAPWVESFWAVQGRAQYARERVLPNGCVEWMFNFGPEQYVVDRDDDRRPTPFRRAWVSGIQERHLVLASGSIALISVRFRPGGAFPVFGLPMSELANQVLELEQVFGTEAETLRQRFGACADDVQRLEALEAAVAARAAAGRPPHAAVGLALRALTASAGRCSIRGLCRQAAVSEKHMTRLFHEQVGITPKRLGRVLRFQNVIQDLARREQVCWSAVAQRSGYADQAHFQRDFRAFSGGTPGEYLRRRGPDGNSVIVS